MIVYVKTCTVIKMQTCLKSDACSDRCVEPTYPAALAVIADSLSDCCLTDCFIGVCGRHISEAGVIGLTKAQLIAKLTPECEQQEKIKLAMAALDTLLGKRTVSLVASFDCEVLVYTALLDRLASSFHGSLAEDDEAVDDFQSLAGLQAVAGKGSAQKGPSHKGSSPSAGCSPAAPVAPAGRERATGLEGAEGHCLLRPWLDHKGQLNQPFWTGLTQRVMSVVMRNPGESEVLRLHGRPHIACCT